MCHSKALLIAAAAFLIAAALPTPADAAPWSKTVPAPATANVEISLVPSGSVRVVGWGNNEVKVESSEKGLAVQVDGDTVRIAPDGPPFDGDVTVHVPARAKLSVKTLSGDIRAEGIEGRCSLATVSGDLAVKGCAGGARLKSVSGSVRAQGIKESVSARSVSGSVVLADIAGPKVEAKSVSGKIELRNVRAPRLQAKGHSGNVVVVGDLPSGGNWQLKSFSGNVEVALPVSASFDVQAKTRSGSIDIDFPMTDGKKEDGRAKGRVGQGGAQLQLKSFSGNLRVKKQ